jgi:hypothetical protein
MKTKIGIVLSLMLAVVLSVNAQTKSSDLLGAWKLVSYKYGDRQIQFTTDSIQQIKLITKSNFIWVNFPNRDRLVREVAGGNYSFNAGNYTESIDFGGYTMKSYINRNQVYKVNVENGKLYLYGVMTDNQKIEEIWERTDTK